MAHSGELAGIGGGTLGPTNAAPLTIGTSGTCHDFGKGFSGLIDEVKIYDHVLSDAEIQAIFKAGNEGQCKPQAHALSRAKEPNNMLLW